MKGTLFSADFIKDESDNLRLLEINTDTACITDSLDDQFDFSNWITILQNNNITTVVLIYKAFQGNIINKIQSILSTDATFITSVELIKEEQNTIYPTAVTDADDKFILRLAYDENALFDSTYAKHRTNVLTLFADNNNKSSVPEFFYEGSEKIYNTFTSSLTSGSNLPDAVRKNINDNATDPLEFVKFSIDPTFESSSEQILNQFYTSAIDTTVNYVEKYHYNPEDLVGDNISSYREFGIVYGSNIDYVRLGSYRIESLFNLPEVNFNEAYTFTNQYYYVPKKHYFELTTNALRTVEKIDGIHHSERILIPNESPKLASELEVSGSVQSFFISGSPDTDIKDVFTSWSFSGNELPSGSYLTSSIVEIIDSQSGDYNSSVEINITSGDSYYVSAGKHFLVYESGSNIWRFKKPSQLTGSTDYFMNPSGSLVQFSSSNFVIHDNPGTFYRVDVETTDNFFLSSSESILVHNAPCFIAGTLIDIAGDQGGTKKIEDVKVGDEVFTYNHDGEHRELKKVNSVMVKENQTVVKYILSPKVKDFRDLHYSNSIFSSNDLLSDEDRIEIQATLDHPLYVIDKGYCSYSPEQTKDDSGHIVQKIEVGDSVLNASGNGMCITHIEVLEEKKTVYNLDDIQDNHNFYANGLLAHNRAGFPYVYYSSGFTCFSENVVVTLPDGNLKKINEIQVGDVVQGWDGEQITTGSVIAIDHTHTVNSHAEACKILGDEPSLYTINHTDIEFTPEHPFLTKDGWKSLVPDPSQEPFKSEQEPKVLQIGDEININGKWEEVFLISKLRSIPEEKVYNITVDKIHSYLANGVVVHNK